MKVSVVRLSTFSNDISSEAVRPIFHISHITSIGRGGGEEEKLCFLFQSDKDSGWYGNL